MAVVTTYVLNTVTGKPAEGVIVELISVYKNTIPAFVELTSKDGRVTYWTNQYGHPFTEFPKSVYILRFHTREYFEELGQSCFYPYVEVTFSVGEPDEHIHIPLLVSNYGYSTYKGS